MTATATATATSVVHQTTTESWVPAAYRQKVERANRRAERAGLGRPFQLAVSSEIVARNDAGLVTHEEVWTVDVTATSPTSLGWEFAATVAWVGDEPVIRSTPCPSATLQAALEVSGGVPRPADKICDACRTDRERHDTFIVFDPERHVFAQVGRNCLTAYTGIQIGWVAALEEVADDELDRSAGSAAPTFDLRFALLCTTRVVSFFGFTSRAQAERQGNHSTADLVADHLLWPVPAKWLSSCGQETRTAILKTGADEQLALDALAWAESLTDAAVARSEYLANVRTLARAGGRLEARHLGTAVSIVGVYQRNQDRSARALQAAAERPAPTLPMPAVGEKIAVQGTVVTARVVDGHFGTSTLVIVDDPRYPAPVKTFTAARWADGVERGAEVSLKATVKSLDEYQGTTSIQVTRARAV